MAGSSFGTPAAIRASIVKWVLDVSGRDLPSYPNPPNGRSSPDPPCWIDLRNFVALAMTGSYLPPAFASLNVLMAMAVV